ncbi:helix-hairpin-helix domain-containing protein [Oceanobacillus sp. CAU 1775]
MTETLKKIIFVVAGCLVAVIFFLFTNDSNVNRIAHQSSGLVAVGDDEQSNPAVNEVQTIESDIILVDIKGEVNKPGVYELKIDSRVNDVIKLAQGFTENADETQINLAQRVQDEMIIIVPKIAEDGALVENSPSPSTGGKVRINYATREEIETLNGIGPSKAQAIIQYREENGMFRVPEDLLQVSGIGEKTLQNFIDQIQIP